MHVKVHAADGGRIVLDSKPIVANIDHYCDRWFGDWKFWTRAGKATPSAWPATTWSPARPRRPAAGVRRGSYGTDLCPTSRRAAPAIRASS